MELRRERDGLNPLAVGVGIQPYSEHDTLGMACLNPLAVGVGIQQGTIESAIDIEACLNPLAVGVGIQRRCECSHVDADRVSIPSQSG